MVAGTGERGVGAGTGLSGARDQEKNCEDLKNLSEGYSRILRLKYIDNLSMKEIGTKLELTVKAVESRLTRARLAFVKEYAKEDFPVRLITDD